MANHNIQNTTFKEPYLIMSFLASSGIESRNVTALITPLFHLTASGT